MRLRKPITALCIVIASTGVPVLTATIAAAHPHVWITMETEILYNDAKAITGFKQKWTFDEFYTSFAIQGLDKNSDGKYDRDELSELSEVNIASLKEFQYFTYPRVAGAIMERLPPKDYWLEHANNNLTLHFTLPLAQPIPAGKVPDFALATYDPTFYVDFGYATTDPVRLLAAPAGCAPIIKNPQAPTTSVQSLGETFFNSLDPMSDLASQYAKVISIACPAS